VTLPDSIIKKIEQWEFETGKDFYELSIEEQEALIKHFEEELVEDALDSYERSKLK